MTDQSQWCLAGLSWFFKSLSTFKQYLCPVRIVG